MFEYLVVIIKCKKATEQLWDIVEAEQMTNDMVKNPHTVHQLEGECFIETKVLDYFGKKEWECFQTDEKIESGEMTYTAKFKRKIKDS